MANDHLRNYIETVSQFSKTTSIDVRHDVGHDEQVDRQVLRRLV